MPVGDGPLSVVFKLSAAWIMVATCPRATACCMQIFDTTGNLATYLFSINNSITLILITSIVLKNESFSFNWSSWLKKYYDLSR